MGYQVLNSIGETPPGAGTVRFSMDLGNVREILDEDLIDSCAVAVSPATTPPLAVVPGSILISSDGTAASALFTGGAPGTYLVTWTPTLVSGQILPPRIGTLVLEGP